MAARLYPRINPVTPKTPSTGTLVAPLRVPGRVGYAAGNDIVITPALRDAAEDALVIVMPGNPVPNAPGGLLPFRVEHESGNIHLRIAFNADPTLASAALALPGDLHVAVVPRLQIPNAGSLTLHNTVITQRTVPVAVAGQTATCHGDYATITTGALAGNVLPITLSFLGNPPDAAINANWFLVLASASDLWPTFAVTEAPGDLAAITQIPWIHVPASQSNITLPGPFVPGGAFPVAGTVAGVRNFGTGQLTIQATSVSDAGAPPVDTIAVHAVVNVPPAGAGNVELDYNAQDGISNLALALTTNDTGVVASGFHENTVRVSADSTVIGVADTILVIDASGSMELRPDGAGYGTEVGLTPADRRRWDNLADAVNHMVDGYISFLTDPLMIGGGTSPTSRLGIAVFPNVLNKAQPDWFQTATTLVAPVPVNTPNLRTTIGNALITAGNALEGMALTPIGEGLKVAMGDTAGSSGLFHPNLDDHRRWLVLMTDGEHNAGAAAPQAFYQPDAVPDFDDKEVRVFSIAYATAATGAAVSLMQNLANNGLNPVSGGGNESRFAPAETTVGFEKDLTDTFLDAMAVTVGLEPNYDPVGRLTSFAPVAIHEFQVAPLDTGVGVFVDWQTRTTSRVQVALISPRCERFTGSDLSRLPGFEYRNLPGYVHAYISDAILRGGDGQPSRYGTWKLELRLHSGDDDGGDGPIILLKAAAAATAAPLEEIYKFAVFNRSGLRMDARALGTRHAAGEPIELVTTLRAHGVPVSGAKVVATVSAPAIDFNTFLATAKLKESNPSDPGNSTTSTRPLPAEAKNTWAAKILGLAREFGPFDTSKSKYVVEFEETEPGIYRASAPHTANPGVYSIHVVATGTSGDIPYRRERAITVQVEAVPDQSRTLITYEIDAEGRLVVRVTPRDRNNRAVVFEPAGIPPRLQIHIRGTKPSTPLTNNFDGTYSQVFPLPSGQVPEVILTWDDEPFVEPQPVPDPRALNWMDRVDHYEPGPLGDDGKFKNPKAALGPVKGPKDPFVSLGGGSIVLGADEGPQCSRKGHFRASHLAVFTEACALASYRVHIRPVSSKCWIALGEGHGPLHVFEIPADLKVRHIAAVMIEDLDERPNGGVRLQGIGYHLQRSPKPKPFVPPRRVTLEITKTIKRVRF